MSRIKLAIGSLAGTGLIPVAPGTWSSFVTVIIFYSLTSLSGAFTPFYMLLTGSLLTLWSAPECEAAWGPDPSKMTMDEFAGQSAVYLFVPFTGDVTSDYPLLLIGFLLFRIFDIMKPLGIRQLQHFPSGFGILLDDILAGLYGCVILNLIVTFLFSV